MNIFSVDPGRRFTKGMSATGKQTLFTSFVGRARKRKFEQVMPDDIVLKWETENFDGSRMLKGEYFVGKLAQRECPEASQSFQENKGHENTAVLILTALHQLGAWGKTHVGLCVPLDTFEEDKTSLKNLLAGKHWITLNGTARQIELTYDSIMVTAEGVATYYAIPEELTIGKTTHIINIGSAKSHIVTFNHESIYMDAQSASLGKLAWEVIGEVPSDENAPILAENVKAEADRKHWGKDAYDDLGYKVEKQYFLTGGVADKLRKEFNKHFPGIQVIENHLFSDCEGTLQLAMIHWGM